MKKILLGLLVAAIGGMATAAPAHRCSAAALTQAKKLLAFHFGDDDRIDIEQTAKALSPLKNPAGKDQYDVLEVWGKVYKGQYRMHFIYAQQKDQCLLMGQEILEYAKL